MSGVLYVVATPIGNLEDITFRAIRILKEVDYILCEDKRITLRLLNKYEIKTKLISFHKFNEKKSQDYVLSLLKSGKNIALVSDSGTPLISDPGSNLINETRKERIKVFSIPGPSSLTSALSVSGLKFHDFLFVGFLPSKNSLRRKIILSFKERSKIIALFIAPHDLNKYLEEIYNVYPDVNIFYSREITKIYEEHWQGSIKELIDKIKNQKLKGEIVLIICFENP